MSPPFVLPHICHPALRKQQPGFVLLILFGFTYVYSRSSGQRMKANSIASRINSDDRMALSFRNTEQFTPCWPLASMNFLHTNRASYFAVTNTNFSPYFRCE